MNGPVLVQVALDARWIELPVQGQQDPGDWASAAVAEALALRGLTETPQVVELYAQSYAAVLEQLRERAEQDGAVVTAAFALVGDGDLLPVTVAELVVARLEPGQGLDDFVDGLVVGPTERFGEPEVDEVATASGPAVRLRQLRIVPGAAGADPSVQTSVVHVWPGPAEHLATMLTSWFSSPVEAEISGEALGEVVASLRWEAA